MSEWPIYRTHSSAVLCSCLPLSSSVLLLLRVRFAAAAAAAPPSTVLWSAHPRRRRRRHHRRVGFVSFTSQHSSQTVGYSYSPLLPKGSVVVLGIWTWFNDINWIVNKSESDKDNSEKINQQQSELTDKYPPKTEMGASPSRVRNSERGACRTFIE